MIRNFKHKGLRKFFESGNKSGLPAHLLEKIRFVLAILDTVSDISMINIPGGRLHELTGNRKEVWSLTINKNWRITFRLEGQDIIDVDFEDYH